MSHVPNDNFGIARMLRELEAVGVEATATRREDQDYAVIERYQIDGGRFAGRHIGLGIPAPPDYPNTVGASIHVRAAPQLHEKTDNVPNVRNIQDSALGAEWRYWSHQFPWPATVEQPIVRLLAQIASIFERA